MARRPLALTAAALSAALAAPAAASADVRVDGHGFGHGVGLSQYGAYGYALRENRGFHFIVGHYYPGTTIASSAPGRLRVRLRSATTQRVAGATLAKAASGRKVRLDRSRTYRLT